MLEDRYGLEVSTTSSAARDAYVDGVDRILAANPGVEERLEAAVEADPGFALAYSALGRQHQLYGRVKEARAAAEKAVELAAGATEREQRHAEIYRLLITGRMAQSLDLTREHVRDHPRDAFALAPATGVFGSIGFSGRIDREPEQVALLEPLAQHYGDDWWFQMVRSFALTEVGRWEEGRELAEKSLAQFPRNPHGAHILAHALYEAGADREALDYLEGWLPDFSPESLMHCHIWWHYCLLKMNFGDYDAAREAFAANCLPGHTTSPSINVFTDATAFLWRSELAGNPREQAMWEAVRGYYESQFHRPIVFVDAHAALPYAALGESDALDACIATLQELGDAGKLPAGTVGATLSKAYRAVVNQDWDGAIGLLEPVLPEVVRVGGSRAQRDLMTNTLLYSYAAGRHPEKAAALLAQDRDRHPHRPVAGVETAAA